MFSDVYKTPEEFEDNCLCAYSVYDFIDNIASDVMWFFQKCYMFDNHNRYLIDLTSYDTPNYKDFSACIEAVYNIQTKHYDIKLLSKIEPSLHGT